MAVGAVVVEDSMMMSVVAPVGPVPFEVVDVAEDKGAAVSVVETMLVGVSSIGVADVVVDAMAEVVATSAGVEELACVVAGIAFVNLVVVTADVSSGTMDVVVIVVVMVVVALMVVVCAIVSVVVVVTMDVVVVVVVVVVVAVVVVVVVVLVVVVVVVVVIVVVTVVVVLVLVEVEVIVVVVLVVVSTAVVASKLPKAIVVSSNISTLYTISYVPETRS